MERRIDVIVNNTVLSDTGVSVTFAGILRARETNSLLKLNSLEWGVRIGDSLFAVNTQELNYSTKSHPEFRKAEHIYAMYTAGLRMLNRAFYRNGFRFDGYMLTENGDFEEAENCVRLSDGKVFKSTECAICADNNELMPYRELRLVNNVYRLRSVCEKCPDCGATKIKGETCRWCRVVTWDGKDIPRKEAQKLRAYMRDNNGHLRYKELVVLKGKIPFNLKKCPECGVYYENDEPFEYGMCRSCLKENVEVEDYITEDSEDKAVIGDYHYYDKSDWYGSPDKNGELKGLGFELEIDGNTKSGDWQSRFNNLFARQLLDDTGLDRHEIVFETDSSLGNGFEIISMPHTVKEFWNKKDCWERMLVMCSEAGFKSHATTTCGLHIHVSRTMFGRSEGLRTMSLAKVHKLYDIRWEDLKRASRRTDVEYCLPNKTEDKEGNVVERDKGTRDWAKTVGNGGHKNAINEKDEYTVEFRLGRGTLNPKSFFAWIDLTLAIVKNSRKSDKTLFSKPCEWLSGIRKDTAEYLVSKNAFVEECVALYPELGGIK